LLNVSDPAPNGSSAALPPLEFSCLTVEFGNTTRVSVAGELDVATAPQLADALHRAEFDARPIVLDLRRLAFMDCGGLRVILAAARRAHRPGGRLVVVRGPAAVARLFALTEVEGEIELVDRPPHWGAALRAPLPA